MRLVPRFRRRGMTLLEVLAAMAIFLISLVAIGQLMTLASQNADDVRWNSRATRLAQSKLGEFVAGVQSVSGASSNSGTFDEEPDWTWNADVSQYDNVPNLYTVTITVSRDLPNGKHIESVLSEYILDPNYRGNNSTGAIPAPTGSPSSSSSTTTTTGGN